jgi:hypothetical protein
MISSIAVAALVIAAIVFGIKRLGKNSEIYVAGQVISSDPLDPPGDSSVIVEKDITFVHTDEKIY